MDSVISNVPSFGILGASAPMRCCGPARFGAALTSGLTAYGANVSVVRVSDGAPFLSTRVIGELINDSPASVAACAELLSQSDIAVFQYGVDDNVVMDILERLRVPSIVIAHTVLKSPTRQQRAGFEAIAARADH